MHTIQLNIDDSIFDKVMTMLELLPQDKIKIKENGYEYPAITKEEAKRKVQKSMNDIAKNNGLLLDEAFGKVLN